MSFVKSTVMFVFVMAIALAANRADEIGMNKDANVRSPASINKKLKPGLFFPVEQHVLKHTEKIKGPLTSVIELMGAKPENPGDIFVIKGIITSTESINLVDFKWNLPEGVEVVSGEVAGTFTNLIAGEKRSVEITLRTLVDENRQIHLVARSQDKSSAFSDVAQFNTLDQEAIDQGQKELFESTQREISKSGRPIKIVH